MQADPVADLARFARLNGYRLAQTRVRVRELAWGGRFALFERSTNHFLYANNDLEQVRGWIASR